MERKPVLVTGATGFTGGSLALELVRRGYQVRALVRPGSSTEQLSAAGVEPCWGDLRNADDVMRAAEGVDGIYHIAAVYRTAGHPDSHYYETNVLGVEHVLAAAREHAVSRTVHCSTVGVHGEVSRIPADEDAPLNSGDVYQTSKLEGELAARRAFENGLPGVIFRPAGIYGPGDLRFLKLFRAVARGHFRMIGSGDTLYHLTYIDDLVEGIILCGEHPRAVGRTYILAGDEYAPLRDIVGLIAEVVGVDAPTGHLPATPVLAAATVTEAICRPLRIEPPLHRRQLDFFLKDRAFSNERAKRELGFAPRVRLAEGIRRTADWYRSEGLL